MFVEAARAVPPVADGEGGLRQAAVVENPAKRGLQQAAADAPAARGGFDGEVVDETFERRVVDRYAHRAEQPQAVGRGKNGMFRVAPGEQDFGGGATAGGKGFGVQTREGDLVRGAEFGIGRDFDGGPRRGGGDVDVRDRTGREALGLQETQTGAVFGVKESVDPADGSGQEVEEAGQKRSAEI